VKGATPVVGKRGDRDRVSIHAPVKGATAAVTISMSGVMFQSTRP